MTEASWLSSIDPAAMLAYVQDKASVRRIRLFACAWWRSIPLHEESHEKVAQTIEDTGIWSGAGERDVDWLIRDCNRMAGQDGSSAKKINPTGAALLRCIFGNPFRCYEWLGGRIATVATAVAFLDPAWLVWHDSTVPKIAQAIYQERDFGLMPILRDALMEAGCNAQELLDHCLEPMHVRGCWSLDILLGKS